MLLTTLGLIHAQVPTSTLNGIVTDPQDAVISGARVTALSEAQGISREAETNASGVYVFSNLLPGSYNLRIEKTGFAPSEHKDIQLEAGRITTLDAKLNVASQGTTAVSYTHLDVYKRQVR